MSGLPDDFLRAVVLLATGDPEVLRITAVSLQVSLAALSLASLLGVPAGFLLATSPRGIARAASYLLHTLTALPTVVVGLGLYFVFSASGPLGWMELLYTRTAMTAGQFVLAFPIVSALTLTAIRGLPPQAGESLATLGIRGGLRMRLLLGEAREELVSALLLAFARVFTELGAAVILGGNIRGHTRTLTSVIALEYNRGDDARAMALGIVLIAVALAANGVVHLPILRPGRRGK